MIDNTELISSSMEAIERNDLLLTQILVRLPLKDVITFKRVSKRWFSLISDPYFSVCRDTVQRKRVSGLFLDAEIDPPDCELTLFYCNNRVSSWFLDPEIDPPNRELIFFYFNKNIRRLYSGRIRILQSCNGLMLLHKFSDTFIYNPTTGAKKFLPSAFPSFDQSRFAEYSLAFDPLRFFGYKLICIFHDESSTKDSYQTMIYFSESGAWNLCGSSFSAPLDMDFAHGVYFKDSVYWIGNNCWQ